MIGKLHVIRFDGLVAYDAAWDFQKRLQRRVADNPTEAFLVLLEHEPVITVGRVGDDANFLLDRAEYSRRGIAVRRIERGGDLTYHGPGQLVGYPILHLRENGVGVREYLRALEEVLINAMAGFRITARREDGLTGVWTEKGKIAAIGVSVSRWVSMHGFALNIRQGIAGFETIVPCGISDRAVTSIEDCVGRPPEKKTVLELVENAFCDYFAPVNVDIIERGSDDFESDNIPAG